MSETDPSSLKLPDIITSFEDPEKLFKVLEPLGEGSYGSVFKARHRETNQLVALKMVPISGEADSLRREVSILKDCDDQHIVKYYGSYYQDSGLEKNL